MYLSKKHLKIIGLFILLFRVCVLQLNAQKNSLKFYQLTTNNGLPQNSIHAIAKDKYGFMWFGTWCGVCRYDGYCFKTFRANENDATAFADNMILAIGTDSAQNIWIKTGEPNCLYKYNYEYENFKRFATKNVAKYIVDRVEKPKTTENKQFKFTTTQTGLKQVNKITGQETLHEVDANVPFSISDASIYMSYIDDANNLWVGTRRGGVNHANLNVKPFKYYHANSPKKGLNSNEIRAICKDKSGRLWVGTEEMGGTIIENTPNGMKYSYFNDKKIIDIRRTRALYCDKLGFVWIGTKGGLDQFDPHTNAFKHYAANDKKGSLSNPIIYTILEDSKGTLWVGTYNGLARYDRQNDTFIHLPTALTGGKQIRVVFEDHLKNLWIAMEDGGLTKLTHTSNWGNKPQFKAKRYVHEEGNENTLISNRLYSLAEDNKGYIWIATNLGLSRLNPKNNTFKHFFIKDGLPDEIIMGLLFDGKESIWISHKKGLTRMNTRTLTPQNFNVNDGLQSNEFNENACFRDHTGEMFFGGQNGLNSFFPERIKIDKNKPKVVFTRLNVMNQVLQAGTKVNDRVILEKSLLCTNEITLTWWDKTFSIEFAALHYANPQGNKYKYKLEGIDKEWIFTDAAMRTASYSQLPSGKYIFKVYGSNNDGVWSDKPATLHIKILPPWWLSWWAIALYLAIGATIILFVHKYIMSRIELNKNEEIHQSKLNFFTGISHEFRTPLTLIIDPLEKLISEKLDATTVNKYHSLMHRNAKQLLLLINQLLDFRKLESGHLTLNREQSDIVAFVKTVAASFESRAKDRNIHFKIQSGISSLPTRFDSAKMNMVLNNLLSNAFKFTANQGEITISISVLIEEKKTLLIKIQDTGMGIPEEEQEKVFDLFYQSTHATSEQEGSGVGLALTKELVELHGGKMTLESKVGQGASFSIFLPILEEMEMLKNQFHQKIMTLPEETEVIDWTDSDTDLPLLLIVDDNTDIRNYIALNFSPNYRIILAPNGLEGFQQAIETIPDLVVSDVMMPGMSGLELCQKLKSDERTSHIPVILLTARQSDESKLEGYETGADAYVTKPFNSNLLQVQIRNLLNQRQRLRELFSHGSDIEIKKISINITDEAFLNKVIQQIHENLEDETFTIDSLSKMLNMSRSQFYRKIKALTNQSLLDFVTTIKMNKALDYLLSGDYNISETAYKVGFSMSSNFTRTFTRHFGVSPSKYLESLKK